MVVNGTPSAGNRGGQTNPDDSELRSALDAVPDALAPAQEAMKDLRRAIEQCWPRKPSVRLLDAESRALYKSATHLVEAGAGRFPSRWGDLVTVIAAAYDTLNAFGRCKPSDSVDFSWEWNATRVDREASPHLDPAASPGVREALGRADASHQRVCGLLDDIASQTSAEAWLPEWGIGEARAYIADVGGQGRRKWQHSRPPQPPHTYTARSWRPDLRKNFLAFVQLIQTRGELKTWGGQVHAYLKLDSFEYWTMGARVPETTVINRAPVDAPGAAGSLSTLTRRQLRRGLEDALAYRRAGAGTETGILSDRLRALIDSPQVP
jgi:hypothetical protein